MAVGTCRTGSRRRCRSGCASPAGSGWPNTGRAVVARSRCGRSARPKTCRRSRARWTAPSRAPTSASAGSASERHVGGSEAGERGRRPCRVPRVVVPLSCRSHLRVGFLPADVRTAPDLHVAFPLDPGLFAARGVGDALGVPDLSLAPTSTSSVTIGCFTTLTCSSRTGTVTLSPALAGRPVGAQRRPPRGWPAHGSTPGRCGRHAHPTQRADPPVHPLRDGPVE